MNRETERPNLLSPYPQREMGIWQHVDSVGSKGKNSVGVLPLAIFHLFIYIYIHIHIYAGIRRAQACMLPSRRGKTYFGKAPTLRGACRCSAYARCYEIKLQQLAPLLGLLRVDIQTTWANRAVNRHGSCMCLLGTPRFRTAESAARLRMRNMQHAQVS